MKLFGSILLTLGFLAGTYVTVAHESSVDWLPYGLCIGCMLVGMILLQIARSNEAKEGGEKQELDINVLKQSLGSLITKVRGLESATSDEEQLQMHSRIDNELMDDINSFVEARESMIPRLGMQTYANVMSPFATGERLLNRAWSASADGYVDESRSCIQKAREELERAKQLLEAARA